MSTKVEISYKTVMFAFVLAGLIWLFSQIINLVLMIFVACILVSALNPLVDRLERRKLPRPLGILVVYTFLILGIIVLVASVIPGLVSQSKNLIQVLPDAISRIDFFTNHQQELSNQLLGRIGSLPENLLKASVGIFGNLLDVVTTLVITFYLLMYRPKFGHFISSLVGPQYHQAVEEKILEIERGLGSWVRGELMLMLAVGSFTYLGLIILGIDIALPLAILAGLLEIVPNIGPLISAIPAVIIGFAIHPVTGIATVCWYFLVQLVENHLLVPNIMRKAAGVNPLVSILSLMVGFKLAGPIGAVLSLPIIIVLQSLGLKSFIRNTFNFLLPSGDT